jgi:hypothetical protein
VNLRVKPGSARRPHKLTQPLLDLTRTLVSFEELGAELFWLSRQVLLFPSRNSNSQTRKPETLNHKPKPELLWLSRQVSSFLCPKLETLLNHSLKGLPGKHSRQWFRRSEANRNVMMVAFEESGAELLWLSRRVYVPLPKFSAVV